MNADSRRHALLAVVAVLCALAVPSCYQVTGYDAQPKMTRAPYLQRVVMYRHIVKDVDEIVRNGYCAAKAGKIDVGCAQLEVLNETEGICHFYIQEPADFNDAARLAVAGHEAYMHCFGAEHGATP